VQFCSSKGKYSTFIWQDDLKIAELSQVKLPLYFTITFVLRMAWLYWLSALEGKISSDY
jgi:hypothetical protein